MTPDRILPPRRNLPYPAKWLCEQLAHSRIELAQGVGHSFHAAGRDVERTPFVDYDLHFVVAGGLEYAFPHKTVRCRAGSCVLLPPELPFRERVCVEGQGVELYFAHFQAGRGDLDPLQALDLPLVAQPPEAADALNLFRSMVDLRRAAKGEQPWGLLHAKARLVEFLALLLEAAWAKRKLNFHPSRVGPPWLWTVLEAIDRGIDRHELDVNALARRANLSPSHFTHQFRRFVGIPPKQLLLRKRLERACALLAAEESLSVKEIAGRCGFADPYHFSAQFKKWTGSAPSDWRSNKHWPD
ncbi:MAG: helix-turn-helix transcriptional regulator [Planctomycetota bacterium]|nr:helix-turn-helix transcriptional regulator [Planctomycetota bacterium]